jgi:peptidyl-tRNA hydrolase
VVEAARMFMDDIDHLGTKNFTRIRIGIGPENKTIPEIENYVMGTFNNEDLEKLQEVIEKVVEEIKRLV